MHGVHARSHNSQNSVFLHPILLEIQNILREFYYITFLCFLNNYERESSNIDSLLISIYCLGHRCLRNKSSLSRSLF